MSYIRTKLSAGGSKVNVHVVKGHHSHTPKTEIQNKTQSMLQEYLMLRHILSNFSWCLLLFQLSMVIMPTLILSYQ
jgi:hypothetical protein